MSPFSDNELSKIRLKMIHMGHLDRISRICSLVTNNAAQRGRFLSASIQVVALRVWMFWFCIQLDEKRKHKNKY